MYVPKKGNLIVFYFFREMKNYRTLEGIVRGTSPFVGISTFYFRKKKLFIFPSEIENFKLPTMFDVPQPRFGPENSYSI